MRKDLLRNIVLGPAFGRTDFSRIFIFEPPDFFADFLVGFFLLIFVGKSAQKNPPGKSQGKSSKIYTTKILQHISADWPGQIVAIIKFGHCGIVFSCPCWQYRQEEEIPAAEVAEEMEKVFPELDVTDGIFAKMYGHEERSRTIASMVNAIWLWIDNYDAFSRPQHHEVLKK